MVIGNHIVDVLRYQSKHFTILSNANFLKVSSEPSSRMTDLTEVCNALRKRQHRWISIEETLRWISRCPVGVARQTWQFWEMVVATSPRFLPLRLHNTALISFATPIRSCCVFGLDQNIPQSLRCVCKVTGSWGHCAYEFIPDCVMRRWWLYYWQGEGSLEGFSCSQLIPYLLCWFNIMFSRHNQPLWATATYCHSPETLITRVGSTFPRHLSLDILHKVLICVTV